MILRNNLWNSFKNSLGAILVLAKTLGINLTKSDYFENYIGFGRKIKDQIDENATIETNSDKRVKPSE